MHRYKRANILPILMGLLLFLGPACALAQDDDESVPLTNGPVPPFQDMLLASDAQNYTVRYPAFGVKTVDMIIAEWAAGLIADAPPEAMATGDDGYRYVLYEMQARYSLSASTPRYSSVVFFTTQAVMAHRENIIYTLNFDLKNQKQLEIGEIFPDLVKSLPLLPELIRKAAAERKRTDGSPIPLPNYIENYANYQDEFARFLTVAFCPEGLNVYLSPTDVVLLHKEELIRIGASAKFW